ncbi:MAG: hypothetical protein JHC26_10445 [Thermofilum sp.]|uniref:hypothetical protein n=1 Tax=Thermofilum sp. TaxID=1961369 RepID=UPI002585F86A|nr:hypothetical protein [Thermofilum sp.]MCI4409499.1 hypothetical protein [Thermofilum sp.]
MIASLGKFALAFIIAFTIINTMVEVDLASVGYPQIPYFTMIINPQAFTAIIHSTAVTNMPFAFLLYAIGLLIFNALVNFVAGIPIVFYEMAAISGNPGLIVGALLIGAMLQAMAWLYLLQILAQYLLPI